MGAIRFAYIHPLLHAHCRVCMHSIDSACLHSHVHACRPFCMPCRVFCMHAIVFVFMQTVLHTNTAVCLRTPGAHARIPPCMYAVGFGCMQESFFSRIAVSKRHTNRTFWSRAISPEEITSSPVTLTTRSATGGCQDWLFPLRAACMNVRTRSGSTGFIVMPSRFSEVPTITASATLKTSDTLPASTPLPAIT